MKTLVLVRRAKSSWPGLADHERPLNKRGRRNALPVGSNLPSGAPSPRGIRSSTPLGRYTIQLMARATRLMYEHVELDERLSQIPSRHAQVHDFPVRKRHVVHHQRIQRPHS